MKKISIALIACITILFCWSCTKQVTSYVPVATPFYYPGVYNFQGVNYTAQQQTLSVIDNLMAMIGKANTQGNIADTAQIKALFNNISSLSMSAAQIDIFNYIDSIGIYSHSTTVGSSGVAGVGTSTLQPGVAYLQSDSGFVYQELIKTAIMEGLLAYQVETIHLRDSINTSESILSMQTNWDAAFGYFDVPTDFPTDTVGSNYWGRYSKKLSSAFGLDTTIMNNYLVGRAAINNGYVISSNEVPNTTDYSAIGDANNIINGYDNLIAGVAIYELGQAQLSDSLSDFVAGRDHLSLSWGFIHSLNYNASPSPKIASSQINSILAAYGTNLYNFNPSYKNVDSIKTVIGNIYGIVNTNF